MLLVAADAVPDQAIIVTEVGAPEIDAAKATAAVTAKRPDEYESLFDPSAFPKGGVHFSAEKGVPLGATWKVEPAAGDQEPELVCLGRPFGYIRTERVFRDCELSFEWRYPSDANANSGVLLYPNGPDRIWPQGVQVQLHRPTAGHILPDGGIQTEKVTNGMGLELPLNEWHRCAVTCRAGNVRVAVNGRKVSEAIGCNPRSGYISIQSEGSEVHFRRIRVRLFK
ncbi:MAG: DUF1080 domain-containing protein [Planctomycetaceae bacterium]